MTDNDAPRMTDAEQNTAKIMLDMAIKRIRKYEEGNKITLEDKTREGVADYICSYCPPYDKWWRSPNVLDDEDIQSIVDTYYKHEE